MNFRWIKKVSLGFIIFILIVCIALALSNILVSSPAEGNNRLSDLDKVRISEADHLRQILGEQIWAGWGKADIPLILYNEKYAFLIGYQNPPSGWIKIPQQIYRGDIWELVADDRIEYQPYYCQRLVDVHISPEAFTVRVGDKWVASMSTKNWMEIGLGNNIRDGLPFPLNLIIPYRLIGKFLTGNTDKYISAIIHESFHAYQGMVYADRLVQAEKILQEIGSRYPWDAESIRIKWKSELNLLANALNAKQDSGCIVLVKKFLVQRTDRRQSAALDSNQINLERLREWEEGLAKYTELAIWQSVARDTSYQPIAGLKNDPDFDGYHTFASQWAQEVTNIRFQASGGEIRFYYSGMAQAFLLDRLYPNWRYKVLYENVYLEDLLTEVILR